MAQVTEPSCRALERGCAQVGTLASLSLSSGMSTAGQHFWSCGQLRAEMPRKWNPCRSSQTVGKRQRGHGDHSCSGEPLCVLCCVHFALLS